MALDAFVTSLHSAIMSWTYFLIVILIVVKIVQFFTGGSLLGGKTPKEYTDTISRDDRRPGKTDKEIEKLELKKALMIRNLTAEHKGNHVLLKWEKVEEASQYQIKKKFIRFNKYWQTARVSNPEYKDIEIFKERKKPENPIYYCVRAIGPAGKGPWSYARAVYMEDRPEKPQIENVIVEDLGSHGQVTITWKPPHEEEELYKYKIKGVGKEISFRAYHDAKKETPVTQYTLKDLKKNKPYELKLYAVSVSGKASKPAVVSFVIPDESVKAPYPQDESIPEQVRDVRVEEKTIEDMQREEQGAKQKLDDEENIKTTPEKETETDPKKDAKENDEESEPENPENDANPEYDNK